MSPVAIVAVCVLGIFIIYFLIFIIKGTLAPKKVDSIPKLIKQGKTSVAIKQAKQILTKDPKNYKKGRANGESLIHDFVNPDVTKSDANCVIISHSHVEWYGEGYYLATPEMDNASVKIAKKINKTSDFGYYPRTGNESYKSTSAVLVSKPIAQAGYPTFVYEIPENITKQDSTDMAKELFKLMVKYS